MQAGSVAGWPAGATQPGQGGRARSQLSGARPPGPHGLPSRQPPSPTRTPAPASWGARPAQLTADCSALARWGRDLTFPEEGVRRGRGKQKEGEGVSNKNNLERGGEAWSGGHSSGGHPALPPTPLPHNTPLPHRHTPGSDPAPRGEPQGRTGLQFRAQGRGVEKKERRPLYRAAIGRPASSTGRLPSSKGRALPGADGAPKASEKPLAPASAQTTRPWLCEAGPETLGAGPGFPPQDWRRPVAVEGRPGRGGEQDACFLTFGAKCHSAIALLRHKTFCKLMGLGVWWSLGGGWEGGAQELGEGYCP